MVPYNLLIWSLGGYYYGHGAEKFYRLQRDHQLPQYLLTTRFRGHALSDEWSVDRH